MLLLGTQRINEQGHLEIGGCDAVELARQFGTPLYVLDEATFRQNMRDYRRAFDKRYPRNEIAYAGKALLCLAVARIVAQEGYDLDVASAGELYTALKAGFPPEKLVFHGNNKSLFELQMAVQHGVGRIVADNLLELEMLERVAAEAGKQVSILIRVTPGIDPHTHRFIRTGQADTKFGLNIRNGYALEGVRRALALPHLRVKGIHCHVGSQLLDTEAQERAVKIMVDFMHTLRKQLNYIVEELNIGGGLGIRYIESHQPPTFEEYAERIVGVLTQQLERRNLPYPTLLQEPGRALVGEAGVTLYTIGAIKQVPIHQPPGTRTYVAVDGGMSDNPRPQLYDAVYTALVANKANQPADTVVTIAGKHCETDILIRNVAIAQPEPGDILAVPSTGAYNYAMSSNYNRFPRPAMVLVNAGHAEVIVERETLDDLLAHDRIPERLRSEQPVMERA
jgi:diaminopimelate decarboxylase